MTAARDEARPCTFRYDDHPCVKRAGHKGDHEIVYGEQHEQPGSMIDEITRLERTIATLTAPVGELEDRSARCNQSLAELESRAAALKEALRPFVQTPQHLPKDCASCQNNLERARRALAGEGS